MRLLNHIAEELIAIPIMVIAVIRMLFRRPPFAIVAIVALLSGTASAQDGWHGQPGEYLGHGPDIRTVWAQQPEYVPTSGYWSIGWAIGPSGNYEQMRFWNPPSQRFTGRVTWQQQRRIYQTFGNGWHGWSDADYGLFRFSR